MKVEPTEFDGLAAIIPRISVDSRGFFMESYNKEVFKGENLDFVSAQDNLSHSVKHVIRGLHFQKPPFAQAKLAWVLYGSIMHVVVDLRKNKSTFGKAHCAMLSFEDKRQLLIPKGFAHGFSVLSEVAGLYYKCDEYYHPEEQAGINVYDPELNIDWQIDPAKAIISPKDQSLPRLSEISDYF
jgi:dTDP-4-dehydrorhamnose 3,5-epimerase